METTKAHRGVDLPADPTVKLGMALGDELPKTAGSVGELFFLTRDSSTYVSDGTTWMPIGGSAGVLPKASKVEPDFSWADKLIPHEGEMVYVRRKEGKLYWLKANDMSNPNWVEIAGTSKIATYGGNGNKKPDGPIDSGEIEEEQELSHIPSGWYQDDTAALYNYVSGVGWKDVSNTKAKSLTRLAEAGEMEYLG
jgi:hypothetical protein